MPNMRVNLTTGEGNVINVPYPALDVIRRNKFVMERIAILKVGGIGTRVEGIGVHKLKDICYVYLSTEEVLEVFKK